MRVRGWAEIAPEHDRRALSRNAIDRENVGAASHDRETSAALGSGIGKGRFDAGAGLKADAVVAHRGDDAVGFEAHLDLDRSLGFRVLDRVRDRFAKRRQQKRELFVWYAMRSRKLRHAFAYDAREVRMWRDSEMQDRFGVRHRRWGIFPGRASYETCRYDFSRRCEPGRGQVFRRDLGNAPDVLAPTDIPGGTMAANTPPTGAELDTLAAEAEHALARIHTKKGDIVFKFFPHDAKQHAAAFIKLARAGFYDGLTFHRVEPKFVIQGGCPQGTGTGEPGYNLDAEFNDQPHDRGAVAMARSSSPNSAGSQFYICIDDARFLDKNYTVFGHTTDGQDVVDQIRVGDVMESVTIETASGT